MIRPVGDIGKNLVRAQFGKNTSTRFGDGSTSRGTIPPFWGSIIFDIPLHVVCVDVLAPKLAAIFEREIPGGRFQSPAGESASELFDLVAGADVLLTRGGAIGADLIERGRGRLKLAHVLGRYPIQVDLGAARGAGITVATMPHGGAMAVADHTMALLLAVARKIVPGHLGVANGAYEALGREPQPSSEWSFAFNWLGFPDVVEIHGKTLGLIGFGEIGMEVARRARGFDMEVLYHRRRRLSEVWEEKLGVRFAPLEALLASSDVVSLHAPHTTATEKLLNADHLARLKPTAILVNTSRGALVDEDALAAALAEGRLAGAGLDVFVQEPLPKSHPFVRLDNVVLAPHTGGGSGGGQRRLIGQVLDNVARFARGQEPKNIVE